MPRCLALALALAACSANPTDDGGRELYELPVADGNTFACATCHALREPAPDGLRRPGHPIGDAANRPSYKGGATTDLREAVNSCLVHWMAAEPWGEDDPRWQSLRAFLEQQAGDAPASALALDIRQPPTDAAGGDPAAGDDVFHATCVVCHGDGATGTERAPPLHGSLLDAAYVAERVRLSGPDTASIYPGLTGGRMPFWAGDRLSDDELRDVIAYVLGNEPTPPADAGPAGGEPDAGAGCAATHPRVGQTAALSTHFHGVSGTARIVDDCTIDIEDFHYDGTGVDVRVYGGLGGDFEDGFPMSDDLLRAGGYDGETITATLPPGTTLDDLDGVSIWCVDVAISFGDATFPPP